MNKVLIIDDSSTVRKLVSSCVIALGGEVVGTAKDGEEGFERFKVLQPDIVLLDVTMPNKDGRDCLREIMAVNPRAFVVMLSSINSSEVISECLDLGAKAFLDKIGNADIRGLQNALKEVIGSRLRPGRSGGAS